jgi:queuosine biosynthesis protein QueD
MTITKIGVSGISFSAAHRVEGHPKCGRLHGHNWTVEVDLKGPIKSDGMVLDFGFLKPVVKKLADELDHSYLYSIANKLAGDTLVDRPDAVFVNVEQTTSEHLAVWFATCIEREILLHLLGEQKYLLIVRVCESPTSFAEYILEMKGIE